jgi:hypothetical protein
VILHGVPGFITPKTKRIIFLGFFRLFGAKCLTNLTSNPSPFREERNNQRLSSLPLKGGRAGVEGTKKSEAPLFEMFFVSKSSGKSFDNLDFGINPF